MHKLLSVCGDKLSEVELIHNVSFIPHESHSDLLSIFLFSCLNFELYSILNKIKRGPCSQVVDDKIPLGTTPQSDQ